MKRLLLCALCACVAPAAAQAESVWVGNFFVTSASSACLTSASAGDYLRMIYRPAGAALGNGGNSYLSYVGGRAGVAMTVPGNTFRAGVNYTASSVGSYITFASGSGGITAWTQSPAVLSAATTHATLSFTLANFFNLTGCTASFTGDLEKAL